MWALTSWHDKKSFSPTPPDYGSVNDDDYALFSFFSLRYLWREQFLHSLTKWDIRERRFYWKQIEMRIHSWEHRQGSTLQAKLAFASDASEPRALSLQKLAFSSEILRCRLASSPFTNIFAPFVALDNSSTWKIFRFFVSKAFLAFSVKESSLRDIHTKVCLQRSCIISRINWITFESVGELFTK